MLSKIKLCLVVLLGISLATQAQRMKTVRLFIIGNSFSGNAAAFLPQLATEGHINLEIGLAELGACSLERHWKLAEANEKAYKGKSLREMLSEGVWDIVTIQQYSLLSGDPATYAPYARQLADMIRSLQPKAKIFIHQTWAYRNDAAGFGRINGEQRAQSAEEMHRHVRAAYHQVAQELGLTVIPVGDAFRAMDSSAEWRYKKDPVYNFKAPVAPQLPDQTNSLHVGYKWNNNNLTFDANHANTAGCYLGSLVWYHTLLGGNIKRVKFKPVPVSDAMAQEFKKIVAAL